jgi:hypothetical protein
MLTPETMAILKAEVGIGRLSIECSFGNPGKSYCSYRTGQIPRSSRTPKLGEELNIEEQLRRGLPFHIKRMGLIFYFARVKACPSTSHGLAIALKS